MQRSCPAWCLVVALLILGPVAWRVLSWERSQPLTVDEQMARAGEALFNHEWLANDPLCPNGDGLGPVFNARSCVACHHQGGAGGGGGLEHNVTAFVVVAGDGTPLRQGVVHSDATSDKYRETLAHLDPALPAISRVPLADIMFPRQIATGIDHRRIISSTVQLSQRNTPALFGAGLIDLIPARVIVANQRRQSVRFGMAPGGTESVPVGRVARLSNGKVGRFGWKAQTARLSEFVQAACASELGLGNPGQAQPPSLADALYRPAGLDLTQEQCDQLTAFVAALPRPVEKLPDDPAFHGHVRVGKALFTKIGCADCHTPNLGAVDGIYSDLLLHRMGADLEGGGGGYGEPVPSTPSSPSKPSEPLADEWRTPPLWGVADSAPYMHDGRAATLEDAIARHGGQAAASASNFRALGEIGQAQVLAFLRTLRAP
jgi:CxxC motif-containing protein (DUF1111 family)